MQEVAKETNFLKDINDAMDKNQNEWKNKIQQAEEQLRKAKMDTVAEKDNKIRELEEQVRDLMFYIDAQKTLSQKSEFVDGEVVVVQTPTISNNSSTSPPIKKAGKGRGKGSRKK